MQLKQSSFFWLATSLQATSAVQDVVNLGYAKYQGQTLSNGISQWVGMRYAAPPLGDLRFRPAIDPHTESSVQDATKV
jgi:carboxylesterase type B